MWLLRTMRKRVATPSAWPRSTPASEPTTSGLIGFTRQREAIPMRSDRVVTAATTRRSSRTALLPSLRLIAVGAAQFDARRDGSAWRRLGRVVLGSDDPRWAGARPLGEYWRRRRFGRRRLCLREDGDGHARAIEAARPCARPRRTSYGRRHGTVRRCPTARGGGLRRCEDPKCRRSLGSSGRQSSLARRILDGRSP